MKRLLLLLLLASPLWAQTNSITITNTAGATQTNRPVSIARVFRQTEIPQYAQAKVAGSAVLTQCDVKNRWPDGSLRFAVVSFIVPSLGAGSSVTVTFQNQSTGNNTGYLTGANVLAAGYDFENQIRLSGTASPTISARTMLTNGAFTYWLQGPIVTAIILEDRTTRLYDVNTDNVASCPVSGGSKCPLHPQIEAWFYPQNNAVEIGTTLEKHVDFLDCGVRHARPDLRFQRLQRERGLHRQHVFLSAGQLQPHRSHALACLQLDQPARQPAR